MKTSQLTGNALDRAVAKCEGVGVHMSRGGWVVFDSDSHAEFSNGYNDSKMQMFKPSTNWAQGGVIIEREKIRLHLGDGTWGVAEGVWEASHPECLYVQRGETPLIAAMRCYVASKLGDEVDIE